MAECDVGAQITFGLIILLYDVNVSGQQFNYLGIFG